MDPSQTPSTLSGHVAGATGVGRQTSQPPEPPAAETANMRKRKRKTLSCVDCKRRKLKCDRMYPACGRCVKGGYPSSCVYTSSAGPNLGDEQDHSESDEESLDVTAEQPPSAKVPYHSFEKTSENVHSRGPTSAAHLLRIQEEQIARLENRLAGLEKLMNGSSLPQISTGLPYSTLKSQQLDYPILEKAKGEVQEKELMLFRGSNYKTHYDGRTFAGALVAKFPELRGSFDAAMKRHPTLRRAHGELLSLYKSLDNPYGSQMSARKGISDEELLDLLPSSEKIRSSIRLYLSTFETTYRILHVPSFNRDFQRYQSTSTIRPDFVATLLLIVATVSCCTNGDPMKYSGRSSVAREDAVQYIIAVEAWLDRHSRKHMTLAFFQLHCLLVLAKRVNSHKVKRTWTTAENVISIAAAAGFHRDPSLLTGRKISPFDQEMKRRLWFTMVELDLLASFEQGMPASSLALLCDTAQPRNVNDEEFDETTEEIPASRPLTSSLTSITFLCAAYQSLPLRLRLNNILNDPTTHLTRSEIMHYTEDLTKHIQKVQELSSLHQTSQSQSHNSAWSNDTSTSLTVLELQLYRYLLHLHRFPAEGPYEISSETFSHHLRFTSATRLIELHHKYWKGGNSSLILSRSDLFDAVINLCQDINMNIRVGRGEESGHSLSSSILILPHSSSTPESFFSTIETALNMLEDRNTRIGPGTGGSHSYWLSLGIYALVRMKYNPEQERLIEQRVLADRITSSYYRVLSRQVDEVAVSMSRNRVAAEDIDKEPPLQTQMHMQQLQRQQQQGNGGNGIPGMTGAMGMDWNMSGGGSGSNNNNNNNVPPLSELPEYSANPHPHPHPHSYPSTITQPQVQVQQQQQQPSSSSFIDDFTLASNPNPSSSNDPLLTSLSGTGTATGTGDNMMLPWGILDDFWGDLGGAGGGGGM